MIITREWLEARGACESRLRIFIKQWPEGAELTLENMLLGIKHF